MIFRLLGPTAILIMAAQLACAQAITVNPLERYQVWLGIGASSRGRGVGNNDYDKLIDDLGASIFRKHLESLKIDQQIEDAKLAQKAADASGQTIYHIGSIWSPEPELKIGPFAKRTIEISGDRRWAGGTLDPTKYDQFAQSVLAKIQKYKDNGLSLFAICLQNEPWLVTSYASCKYTWEQYQAMFRAVAPQVKKAHPDVKIIAAEQAFAIGGDNQLFAKFLARDPQCLPHLDAFAYHGKFPGHRWKQHKEGEAAFDPRPGGAMSEAYRERLGYTQPDVTGYIPHWQTECNIIKGWKGNDNSIWQEAACMLTFIRDMHGQMWLTYEWSVELTNPANADRYQAWKHFGKYIEPGATVIASGHDPAARISSIALHDTQRRRLTLVLLKMGEGEGTTKIEDANIKSAGRWYVSDESRKWIERGEVKAGQAITMPGFSIATVVFDDYHPNLSRAKQMLKPRVR